MRKSDTAQSEYQDLTGAPAKGASVFSSIASLTNCVIGSGVLALPFAFQCAGLVGGAVFLTFITIACGLSFLMLVTAGDYYKVYTYKDVARNALGKKLAPLAELVVICYTLGTVSSYGVIVGDSASNLMAAMHAPEWLQDRKLLVAVLLAFLMVPLSMLSNLDVLRFTSASAVFNVLFVVGLIIFTFFTTKQSTMAERGDVTIFNGSGFFAALPLMGVAYTAHYNVLALYKELRNRTKPRMRRVVNVSTLICFAIYISVAVCGYLLYRNDVESNILNVLNSHATGHMKTVVLVAEIGFLFTIAFSYPLVAFALKRAVSSLFLDGDETPQFKQNIIACVVGVLVLIIGVSGINLSSVLRVSGSFFGTLLVYVLPGTFYRVISKEKKNKKGVLLGWLEIVVGFSVMILGTASIIQSL